MRVFQSVLVFLSYFSARSQSGFAGVFILVSFPSSVSAADCENVKVMEQGEDRSIDNGANHNGVCENGKSVNADEYWWEDSDVKMIEMWKLFKCDKVFENDRPAHNESTWMLMRGAYIGVVGPDKVTMDAVDQKNEWFGSGFKPKTVEVKVTEDKGRGVYATKTFEKGELVWSPVFTACFTDGMEYRKFLASVPSDLACDVFEWAYSDKDYGVCVDLDEGSFINHASAAIDKEDWEIAGNDEPNIARDAETGNQNAVANINPGDEILTDYYSFEEDAWELFGLGTWEGLGNDHDDN